jgi:DNA primase large subunit
MPYIQPSDRKPIDPCVESLSEQLETVGDLNYAITRLATKFLLAKGLNYEEINAVAGVLQKVAAEFDVRVTRPYEELKIWQNGDIPEYKQISDMIGNLYPVS